MNPREPVDALVVGGGVVGMAIAYGLARSGASVEVIDEGDDAFRAARGNFGLVWVQGKGGACPDYARWSRESARLWPEFARRLSADSGVELELSQRGGLMLCLDEPELAQRVQLLESIAAAADAPYPFEVWDRNTLRARVPAIGERVLGATYTPMDGHVSPLRLLRALVEAFRGLGGCLRSGLSVRDIRRLGEVFHVDTGGPPHLARRIVLAAGLGNRRLAPLVGLDAPVRPNRGQVMVTERMAPFLELPTGQLRQTGEGSVQIGDSLEDVGFDDRTTTRELARIAERALLCFPRLGEVNVVRSWGALRVMTPDGMPIYQASTRCPGAFVATCHSGITLAAHHAGAIADWVRGGPVPRELTSFQAERFHVQAS
jgi:octopine oxidase subunit B